MTTERWIGKEPWICILHHLARTDEEQNLSSRDWNHTGSINLRERWRNDGNNNEETSVIQTAQQKTMNF